MEPNEAMVENEEMMDTAADDTLEDGAIEEEQDESETLDSLLTEEEPEDKPDEEPKEKDSQGTSEPGWIRKRVDKAVSKAVAETEARMRAEFEAQMAPIREKMIEDEAAKLVRQGTVKDLDTARELVRYRQGSKPVASAQEEQPRNANGQFASKDDPATTARINMLKHQYRTIMNRQGLDVITEYMNNAEIKQKVISGEMDFYDVAETMQSRQNANKSGGRKPPSPVRSPNGASGSEKTAIDNMSDEQFERLEKRIKEGARYTLKR